MGASDGGRSTQAVWAVQPISGHDWSQMGPFIETDRVEYEGTMLPSCPSSGAAVRTAPRPPYICLSYRGSTGALVSRNRAVGSPSQPGPTRGRPRVGANPFFNGLGDL